jgi:hypothetical protein
MRGTTAGETRPHNTIAAHAYGNVYVLTVAPYQRNPTFFLFFSKPSYQIFSINLSVNNNTKNKQNVVHGTHVLFFTS